MDSSCAAIIKYSNQCFSTWISLFLYQRNHDEDEDEKQKNISTINKKLDLTVEKLKQYKN